MIAAAAAATLSLGSVASAQTVIDFEDPGDAALFTTATVGNATVDLAYDYSGDTFAAPPVIPGGPPNRISVGQAPSGTGSTGIRMAARGSTGDAAGDAAVILSSLALNQNWTITVDMFQNYNGLVQGGGGSTEFSMVGLANSADVLSPFGGSADGFAFTATGEGGAAGDYRIYYTDPTDDGPQFPKANAQWFAGNDGVDANGVEPDNNFHDFYDGDTGTFDPNGTDPFGPDGAFDGSVENPNAVFSDHQTPGAAGKDWVVIEIDKVGDIVTLSYDGIAISELTLAETADGFGSVYLGYSDIFATSVPDDLADAYVLFDNLSITETPIPEPASLGLLGMAGLGLIRRRRA